MLLNRNTQQDLYKVTIAAFSSESGMHSVQARRAGANHPMEGARKRPERFVTGHFQGDSTARVFTRRRIGPPRASQSRRRHLKVHLKQEQAQNQSGRSEGRCLKFDNTHSHHPERPT